jgi:hypothetical protein
MAVTETALAKIATPFIVWRKNWNVKLLEMHHQ